MRFIFDEKKAAQAAAFLLKRHGDRLNYMVLIKLLYLADRRALAERGLPITGDRMMSMPKGPVLSGILDLINWGSTDENSFWLEYISPATDYDVSLAKVDPEFRSLSRYELKVLQEIDDQFGAMDKWSLVKFTHRLQEWRDPHGSSFPIEPAEILRSENRSEEEIAQIGFDADVAFYVQFLTSAPGR
ncbi:Panacea domain-containing protein [Candidatus Binatus sp.]|uniref:Panacea domain-containing protein n=1 Tax=Candidatus Binatus sp. TaxID=2811406 RepID=UPI002F418CC5